MARPRNPDIEPGSRRARGRTLKGPDPAPATRSQQLLAEMKRRGQKPGDRLHAFIDTPGVPDLSGHEWDSSRAYSDASAPEQLGRPTPMLSDEELAAL
jgi:hypothetical protein